MVAKRKIHAVKLTTSEQAKIPNKPNRAMRHALKDALAKGEVAQLPVSGDVKVKRNKVTAKPGLTDQQAKGQVLGSTIVTHIAQHDSNLFSDMNALIAANNFEYHSACYGIVVNARDADKNSLKQAAEDFLKDAKDSLDASAYRKTKKESEARLAANLNNSAVKFSRIIKVIQVIGMRYAADKKDIRVVDFGGCQNFAQMVSVARLAVPNKVKHLGALTKGGFDSWAEKMTRIVDLAEYDEKEKTSQEQKGRAESFIQSAIMWYQSLHAEINGMRPLADIIKVCEVTKKGKQRKAA